MHLVFFLFFIFMYFGCAKTGKSFFESPAALPRTKASTVVFLPKIKVSDSGTIDTLLDSPSSTHCVESCLKPCENPKLTCRSVSFNLPSTMCILSANEVWNVTTQRRNFLPNDDFDSYAL